MAEHLKKMRPLLRLPVEVGIFSYSERSIGPKFARRYAGGFRTGEQNIKVGRNWRDRVNARRANSFQVEKYLKKVGLGKEDHHFWKQIGKGLLCSYALWGAVWLWNETSPLGWWTLMPKPKEEKELAHLYERIRYPYPGDKEAMDEFVAKGGMIGTTIGPKGYAENDEDFVNIQKELQDKKFEQEAMKLWLRMKSEVISELQEKGFEVE